MKFFIVLAVIASASAVPAIVNTGASAVSRSDDGHGNYAFGYNEDHATGGTFRKEKGGPGVQVGSYGLRDADGRVRTVNYVADALGFRASVSTNEPGTDPHQPAAATTLNGNAPVIPALNYGHDGGYGGPVGYAAGPVLAAGHGGALLGAGPVLAAGHGGYAAGPVGYAGDLGHGLAGHGLALPSAYSVATQHVSAGPVLAAGHGGALLGAGPLGYDGYGAGHGAGLAYGGKGLY